MASVMFETRYLFSWTGAAVETGAVFRTGAAVETGSAFGTGAASETGSAFGTFGTEAVIGSTTMGWELSLMTI